MNNQELIDKYGGNKLVCYFVDVTHQFENNHPDNAPLKKVAGKIYECHVTTLNVLVRYHGLHGYHGTSCVSAGYRMSNEYWMDDVEYGEDENDYGSYLWAEEVLRDQWARDSTICRNVESVQSFFILNDDWQPDLDTWRTVWEDLQRDHRYVGYMKPEREGNWYDGLERWQRNEVLMTHLLGMFVSHGDFTGNGTIPDDFTYDETNGWEPSYQGVVEIVNVNYGNYRSDDWYEVE